MQGVRGSSPLSPTIFPPFPMTTTTPNVIKLEINGRSFEASEGTTLSQLFSAEYKEGTSRGSRPG